MAYTPKTWYDNQSGGTPITAAELNRMEEGIQASLGGSGLSFVAKRGSRLQNYEYVVFRQNIVNSPLEVFAYPYFYVLEGIARCTGVSPDGTRADFGFAFEGNLENLTDGHDMYFDYGESMLSAGWYSVLEYAELGYTDRRDHAFHINPYGNSNALSSLVRVVMSISSWGTGSLSQSFICQCYAQAEPVVERTFFSQADVTDKLTVRFRLKLIPTCILA